MVRRIVRVCLLGFCISVMAPLWAAAPVAGGGRVDFGGGWRYAPDRAGIGASARFGYQADEHLMLGITIGAQAYDQYPDAGRVRVIVGKLRLATSYQLRLSPRLFPYVTVGFGYDLISAATNKAYSESGATGLSAGLGVFIPLTARLGLVIEDRFDYGKAALSVHGAEQTVQGTGNFLWIGLSITVDPEKSDTHL